MSAIFAFTFDISRMTEVLTPDIYRAHWAKRRSDENVVKRTGQC